jgi:hypothetical protein
MDTWIHGYMDTWIHGYMDTWIHGYMDTWIHGYMDTWIHGYILKSQGWFVVICLAPLIISCVFCAFSDIFLERYR